jgi:hypothetical protein
MKPGPDMDLGELAFVENIFGQAENNPGVPVVWELTYGRYNQAGEEVVLQDWIEVTPNPNIIFEIPKCDHWWRIRGRFFLWYHIADGYYVLYYAICPSPVL